jgi:hypothetical protein
MLEFHDSDDRKRYSDVRIDNNIKAAAQAGKRILQEHGQEFLRELTLACLLHVSAQVGVDAET